MTSSMWTRLLWACLLTALANTGAGAAARTVPRIEVQQDEHRYVVQDDGSFVFTNTTRLRVTHASQLARAAVQRIPFNALTDKIQVLEAYRERPGQRRVALSVADIHRRAVKGALEPGASQLELGYRGLAVGDSLYFRVRAASAGRLGFKYQFFTATLPAPGPVSARNMVVIDVPASMPIRAHAIGYRAASARHRHGRTRYTWRGDGSMREPMEVDAADLSAYKQSLVVTSFPDFASFADHVGRSFRRQAQADPAITRLVREIVGDRTDPRARALAVHRWVKQNIRYEAVYVGADTTMATHSAASILARGAGDCKDHVVLMQAMLDAVGIASTPVMADMGFDLHVPPPVAYPGYFDHVLTYIPSLDLYLDGTSKNVAGDYLPSILLDKAVILLNSGALAHTPINQDGSLSYELAIDLHPDGSAGFAFAVEGAGYNAEIERDWAAAQRGDRAGQSAAEILQAHGWHGNTTEDFPDAPPDPARYRYGYRGRIDRFPAALAQVSFEASSSLHRKLRYLALTYDINKQRTHPFVCEPQVVSEHAIYTWPGDREIEAIPPDVQVRNDLMTYSASYRLEGHRLTIDRSLRFGKEGTQVCTPEDAARMWPDAQAMKKDVLTQIHLRSSASSP